MLADRYELRQELGKGGMGVVYQGYDTRLNRAVAIKFISKSEIGTAGRARLMAEAKAAAQLNHPNIVTIYDAVDDETPFIVMELVEGKTLRETPIKDLGQAIEYTRQICLALDHAHQKKVVHRDLKPENVVVLSNGSIKLMDFGLARAMNTPHITEADAFVGTVSYVAPEILQGQEPTPQSDLYALGIVLFELLTGTYPYPGSDIIEIMGQHLYAPIPSPNKIRPDIPDSLNDLVIQLLSKRPEERPLSAAEVGDRIISLQIQQNRATRPPFSDNASIQSLIDLAEKRKYGQNIWDKEWQRRGYIKSSLPMLESVERELVLSNQANELKRAIEHLKDHRLLIISGMPGIGKSTLARTLLEFMPVNSPPPFWYDFERQQTSGNTLGILLDRISSYLENCLGDTVRQEVMSFRHTPENEASAHEVDVLIDYLNQETPIWLVFDNLETVLSRGSNEFKDPGLELLFDGLKSNTHNAKVIVTNPFVPILHNGQYLLEFGTQPLTLQGLDEKSSVEYLRAYGLHDFPEETLLALARNASGHPFTLNHIAHYVQAMGVTPAMETLQGELGEITDHFRATLEQRLSHREFSALQALSILNREISLEGLCKIANTSMGTIKRLREEGLLQINDTGKFWLHNIVRTSLSTTSDEITRLAHSRAENFYRSQRISPQRETLDDFAEVMEWHYHAVKSGDVQSSYFALFSTGLVEQLTKWNEYTHLVELCEEVRAIAGRAAKSLSSKEMSRVLHTLGTSYFHIRDYDKSITILKSALDMVGDSPDMESKLDLLIYLAYAYNERRDLAEATSLCQQILALVSSNPNDRLMAKALHLRGRINLAGGHLEDATSDLDTALALYKKLNDALGIGNTTGDLGIAYYYRNDYTKAIEMYRDAIAACESQQNAIGVMIGHFNIGDFFLQDGQHESAAHELQLTLELARKKKIKEMELYAGFELVDAYISLLYLEKAESELDKLRSVLQKNFRPCLAGLELVLTAQLYWKKNELAQAEDCFKRGFQWIENESCRDDPSGRSYLAFARFLMEMGNVEDARIALDKGRKIFTELRNHLGILATEKIVDTINSI
jgi:serine/threonine protein kinase/tetratricopeptide (TPR) repeat protein